MSGPRAVWRSTRCLRYGHGASALNLAAVGHWSCTFVPCDIRCPGDLRSWWHEKHRIGASPARVTLIREVPPKVQTTSPKNGKNGLLWVRWSAIWANPGTRQTRPPTTATFRRNTADKSPPQQHDVSIPQGGSHHLQHQLSAPTSRKVTTKPTRFAL